ncbi:MAG TPA: hypothetical protein VEB42_02300 [Chitinophagaceae bacterium]|nr:hypothetical protein [Chitinophagaceae bacterium]
MTNLTAYIAYFRSLAVAHKDIQHNPESETGDAPIDSKKFCKWNAEEVVAGLRTTISFVPAALLIELYETNFQAQQAYDIKQKPKGAFTVLCKAANETADEERALTLAEKITYELLQKIWQDHHGETATLCNSPFKRFWFDRLEIIPVGPLFSDHCFGYRVEFEFEFQQTINIITAPEEGVFNL